jgi:FKBP-type peptidyl-prolyl cis-trans isomerase
MLRSSARLPAVTGLPARILVAGALALAGACGSGQPAAQSTSMTATKGEDMKENSGGLVITDLKPGSGAAIAVGQTAVVQYTGWLYSSSSPDHKGTKFDSSRDHGEPFSFRVGGAEVISGWDQGVAGMRVGGERRLVIPPELGYGSRGAGGVIPPGATLVFDIELLGIR